MRYILVTNEDESERVTNALEVSLRYSLVAKDEKEGVTNALEVRANALQTHSREALDVISSSQT